MNLTRYGFAFLILLLACSGCDQGLAPLNAPSGFRGVIHFKNWPSVDSVWELRIIAFYTYPTDSANILIALANGNAAVYPPIGASGFRWFVTDGGVQKFRDSLQYTFATTGSSLQVSNYGYVVLAWRYGPNFLTDWRPGGVYSLVPGANTPSPVRVLLHRIQPDVDILVDFHNLPPRPWR